MLLFRKSTGFIVAIIASIAIACPSKPLAQPLKAPRLCPLPSTSEEILRARLAITEYVDHQFGPPAAWAMRAGHAALLDHWAKDRLASANQAKTKLSLAPLTQWLALGRSSSLQEIQSALESTVEGRPARPLEPESLDHDSMARKAVMHLVLASVFVHGRHKEAMELFPHLAYPGDTEWHISFLVNVGALDQAIELYRRPPTSLLSFSSQRISAIANGLIRVREFHQLASFLDAELLRIREYLPAKPSDARVAWNFQEPILQRLSRLGRTDWRPPDPLPESSKLTAVASLISALRLAGQEEEAERIRKRAHERLKEDAADRKQRQATGKPLRVEQMLFEIPSPATFDLWIDLERAYALMLKGDLEKAEKIVRPEQVDRFTRFSRAAVLSELATYASQQRLWSKAEELLTIATSEPLFPPFSVPRLWLAAASDAQEVGESSVAVRWMKNAATAFCKLEPDRLERHHGLPVGHPGNRKPFVIPYLDSLYVLAAVTEGRLPANAR